MSALFKLVQPWLRSDDSDDILVLHKHLMWLQKELFNEYEPHQYDMFDDKLAEWLQNIPDGEGRKSLFRLLDHFLFVSKQQFDALCRAAFNDDITRWLIDRAAIDIVSPYVEQILRNAVDDTWFCPLTDSMRINSFLKLNGLRGHDNRPDWYSLRILGDTRRIREYITYFGIKRIVLLEDFVGSGSQMEKTLTWAAGEFPSVDILFVPLICCPAGVDKASSILRKYSNLSFAPTLSLRPELFLLANAVPNEPELFALVRKVITAVSSRLGDYQSDPFGFEDTGALVAMYSNCPDNTLPIIHHETDSWTPLFSRVQRS